MVFRLILPDWAVEENPSLPKVVEGEFNEKELNDYNAKGYNVYWLPNCPSSYEKGVIVESSHIDTFNYVFVDMDLKENKYPDKKTFIDLLMASEPIPTYTVDSGHGIHAYWLVSDLDAMSFLKFQRRLIRKYNTDVAVAKIYQLMRLPDTINTKVKGAFENCEFIEYTGKTYTSEQLDSLLLPITLADEEYCKQHYNKTYKVYSKDFTINDTLPPKFGELISSCQEAKDIWSGNTDDRSKTDFRLGHLMFANGFTKEEATSVLVNSQKALERGPTHRLNYALGIVDKIWTFELEPQKAEELSLSVKDILAKGEDSIKGTRFPCSRLLDATAHGFRLGQVIGLVAGSGVGKTAMALNMFKWFVERNPDYIHFFVPLEQPANEIADRWRTMCGDDTRLHEKVHVISNYASDGSFRHLTFDEIRDYLLEFQRTTGKKAGCVVVDHIAALKKKTKDGENQGLMDICHEMKAFAVATNTLLVMQSQSNREKAGIGDLELNKDAAYGTVFFESYCDYLVTIWQPVKRCYNEPDCPTITAFKFCKIRHKKTGVDEIQEDTPYLLFFDPKTEHMRKLTQKEETAFDFFNKAATSKRKADRKTDILSYKSTSWVENGKTDDNTNQS